MTKAQREEQEKAREDLRELIKPGDTVYTKLVHCSRSGMYRTVDLYVFRANARNEREAEPLRITWGACAATGNRYDRKHEAMGMGGCGMDMGFAAVYDLSHALYGNGYDCLKLADANARCPSNEHVNSGTRENPQARHTDGYALRHRWI